MRYFLRYLKTNLTKLPDSLKLMVRLFPPPACIPYQQTLALEMITGSDPDNKLDLESSSDLDAALQIAHTTSENENEIK